MVIAIVSGLAFSIAAIFFSPVLIGFFNFREKEVAAEAALYLSIIGFSMPITFVASVVVGTFNASGNSKTPFIIISLGLAVNVIIDPIFIFTLNMGVRGAAIASVIAQFMCGIALLWALLASRGRPFFVYRFRFRPELKKIKMLLRWSLPVALEGILFCFLSMVTSRFEISFGADAVAVSKVGIQIESLSWLIGGGYGSALIAFIGQNYGAKKWERIYHGIKISTIVMFLWGSFVTFLLLVPGAAIFSLFLPVPALIVLGKQYLFILAFAQLPMALETVASAGFKGSGRTIPPSLVSIVSNIIRPILAYILSHTSLGLYGVWLAVTITTFIRALWVCVWYVVAAKKDWHLQQKRLQH
jgi:putative MATE family efflux protein